jgi:diamine N-acetyltransferase
MSEFTVARNDPVSFRKVTWETFYDIAEDLRLAPGQDAYVSSNALSIGQAGFNPGAWYRAIYAGDVAVGFFMLFDPQRPGAIMREMFEPGDVGLWRFMIDARYQGMGFGHTTLDMICALVRNIPHCKRLTSSVIPGRQGPEIFYLKYGFKRTGRFRDNGREVEISIVP